MLLAAGIVSYAAVLAWLLWPVYQAERHPEAAAVERMVADAERFANGARS